MMSPDTSSDLSGLPTRSNDVPEDPNHIPGQYIAGICGELMGT